MRITKIFPIVVLAIIIVIVPIIRCTWFFDSYLIKLWVAQFGVAILCLYFAYDALVKKEKFQLFGLTGFFLLAYLFANIVSWVLIQNPYNIPALPTLAAIFTYILLCFLTAQYIKQEKTLILVFILWTCVTAGICIYSIIQYSNHSLVMGTLGNPNFLASHIGVSIPICIGLSLYMMNKYNSHVSISAICGIVIIILFILTLYLTHARGAWLGFLCAIISFGIFGWTKGRSRIIIFAIFIAILIAIALTPWGIRFIIEQFEGNVRPPIWKSTLFMAFEKPLLGWGKGAYFIFYPKFRAQEYWLTKSPTDLTVHAHNEYLQILSETGIVGLCVFLLLVYFVLRSGIKKIDATKGPQRYLFLGAVTAIIGLLIHNLVCNNLQMPSSAIMLWIILGLVTGGSNQYKLISLNTRKNISWGILLALTLFEAIIIWQVFLKPAAAQFLFKQGVKFREREEWTQAIGKYDMAMKWLPHDVEMHYRTAYAYTMADRYNEALREYENVLRLAPLYGSVHKNMGMVYMKRNDYKDAYKSFLKQLSINENDLIAYVNLQKAKEMMKNE